MERRLYPRVRRNRMRLAVGAAALIALIAGLPVFADDVPIVQGSDITRGALRRQPITPPAEPGYTGVSAISSNPQVVQTNGVTLAGGAWGVNFTVTGTGVAVVIVMWTNPTSGAVLRQGFVVASGVHVDSASRIVISIGSIVPVPAPKVINATAYALESPQASQAVSVQVRSGAGVGIRGQNMGRGIVQIQLPADQSRTTHYQIVIVTVVAPGKPPVY